MKKFLNKLLSIVAAMAVCLSTIPVSITGTTVYAEEKTTNILFVGNSMTSTKESITRNLKQIIADTGENATIDTMICFGKGFKEFADRKGEYGKRLRKMLKKKKYDYIVFQEQPSAMVTAFETETYPCFKTLKKLAVKNGAKPIIFMTWRFNYVFKRTINGKKYKYTPKQMLDIMAKNSLKLGAKYHTRVVTAGLYFEYSNKINKDIFLWRPKENKHQGYNGAYLVACVFYRELFQKSTSNINYYGKVSKKNALKLQKVADMEMSINKKKLELKLGKSAKLKAKISSLSQNKRYNAKKDNYTYESANTKVATVNKYGRVKAVGKGRTLIYVTSQKTGFMKACTVVVK